MPKEKDDFPFLSSNVLKRLTIQANESTIVIVRIFEAYANVTNVYK